MKIDVPKCPDEWNDLRSMGFQCKMTGILQETRPEANHADTDGPHSRGRCGRLAPHNQGWRLSIAEILRQAGYKGGFDP